MSNNHFYVSWADLIGKKNVPHLWYWVWYFEVFLMRSE